MTSIDCFFDLGFLCHNDVIRRFSPVLWVQMLLPRQDDDVGENSPVRAMDAFVNALGFGHTETWSGAGHPPFDPVLLLKLSL